MMQLDDDDYSVQDIVTFLGDGTHSLVRINQGKSRDRLTGIGGDTMKLEASSPKGTTTQTAVKSSEQLMQEVKQEDSIVSQYKDKPNSQGQANESQIEVKEDNTSPNATATLREDSRRQSIPISKKSTQNERNNG